MPLTRTVPRSGFFLDGKTLYDESDERAPLVGPSLTRANLAEANLYCADLTGANLAEANLTGANFASASLTDANLHEVVEEDTIWPYEFAGENAVEDARWALREAWKQVEQKEEEQGREDRAA